MKYKLCRNPEEARTSGYVGSITSKDDSDYQNMLENCKRHNKHVRAVSRKYGRKIGDLMRVRLMGRGPRVEASMHYYNRPRALDSYLPLGLAESFDVYYDVDSTANYVLDVEMKTGQTAAEQRRIADLKHMAWMTEWEAKRRLKGY